MISYLLLRSVVREISFEKHTGIISQLRRELYGEPLVAEVDEFDPVAHHFAYVDHRDEILGVLRVLRSDEVPRLELQCESRAKDLVFPSDGLIMECSRACTRKGSYGRHLLGMCLAVRDYAVNHKADYMVAKTDPVFLPIYLRMGFRIFGKPFISDWFDDDIPKTPIILNMSDLAGKRETEDTMVW